MTIERFVSPIKEMGRKLGYIMFWSFYCGLLSATRMTMGVMIFSLIATLVMTLSNWLFFSTPWTQFTVAFVFILLGIYPSIKIHKLYKKQVEYFIQTAVPKEFHNLLY